MNKTYELRGYLYEDCYLKLTEGSKLRCKLIQWWALQINYSRPKWYEIVETGK